MHFNYLFILLYFYCLFKSNAYLLKYQNQNDNLINITNFKFIILKNLNNSTSNLLNKSDNLLKLTKLSNNNYIKPISKKKKEKCVTEKNTIKNDSFWHSIISIYKSWNMYICELVNKNMDTLTISEKLILTIILLFSMLLLVLISCACMFLIMIIHILLDILFIYFRHLIVSI